MILLTKQVVHKACSHLKAYEAQSVLELVAPDAEPLFIKVEGKKYRVNRKSLRLQCLKRSPVCVICGRVGTIMSLDRSRGSKQGLSAHFNLYCEDADGRFVMMTKDHILPKFWGGQNHTDNLQTMCNLCNSAKGATREKEATVCQKERSSV